MHTSLDNIVSHCFMVLFVVLGILLIISIYRFIAEIIRIKKSKIRGTTLAIILAILTAIMVSLELYLCFANVLSKINIVF